MAHSMVDGWLRLVLLRTAMANSRVNKMPKSVKKLMEDAYRYIKIQRNQNITQNS